MRGTPLKTPCHRHNACPGGIRLALVALLAVPSLTLPAQEVVPPPKVRIKVKGKEPERPGPVREVGVGRAKPEVVESRPGLPPRPVEGLHPATRMMPQRLPPGPGVVVVRTRDGGEIHRGPGGAVREVRTPGGAVIHVAPDGMRHVEVVRPDGRVVFANGNGHGGYIQRPFLVHGQAFEQRTYVDHGVVSIRVYRPYVYGGVTFHVYQPNRYYRPAYYAWAGRPWGRPVYYPWGWAGRPWFGYYRGYYTPYPFYTSPIFWLTDFMVATTLESAYQARMDNGAAAAPPYDSGSGVSPEVKQAIADEVQLQVNEERAEQQAAAQGYAPPAGPPPLFSSNVSRIFLVAGSVPAYRNGQECYLSEGDVLQLNGAPPPNATYADVRVLSSRTPGCPRGSMVSVSLLDLQEMQNHMRATIDTGLGDLQAQQGQAGLPPMPPQNLGASDAPYASGIQPDANASGELTQVAQEANQAGQTTLGQMPAAGTQAAPPPAGAPAPATLSLGMTVDQVQALLGSPTQSTVLGPKRIDSYPSCRVVFVNGLVSDIE